MGQTCKVFPPQKEMNEHNQVQFYTFMRHICFNARPLRYICTRVRMYMLWLNFSFGSFLYYYHNYYFILLSHINISKNKLRKMRTETRTDRTTSSIQFIYFFKSLTHLKQIYFTNR